MHMDGVVRVRIEKNIENGHPEHSFRDGALYYLGKGGDCKPTVTCADGHLLPTTGGGDFVLLST